MNLAKTLNYEFENFTMPLHHLKCVASIGALHVSSSIIKKLNNSILWILEARYVFDKRVSWDSQLRSTSARLRTEWFEFESALALNCTRDTPARPRCS